MGNGAQTGALSNNSGTFSAVGGESAIAMGKNTVAYGNNSIAMGDGAATGVLNNNSGVVTITGGESAVAMGKDAKAFGNYSVAMGQNATANEANSFAFGGTVETGATNGVAIGLGSSVTETARNSVALGAGSTAKSDNVVSVGSSTNQRKIVNVAEGKIAEGSIDAVTGGQLYETNKNVENVQTQLNSTNDAVAKLETGLNDTNKTVANIQNQVAANTQETREVGAMSAALAGLHYVEPTGEGDDKFTGAVAYGGYRGESAAAVGVAYKPSPNLMVSASTSVGNSQNMYNAGVAFKFGPGKTVNKAALQKQIKYLDEENSKLKAENAAQSSEIQQLKQNLNLVLERLEKLEKGKK